MHFKVGVQSADSNSWTDALRMAQPSRQIGSAVNDSRLCLVWRRQGTLRQIQGGAGQCGVTITLVVIPCVPEQCHRLPHTRNTSTSLISGGRVETTGLGAPGSLSPTAAGCSESPRRGSATTPFGSGFSPSTNSGSERWLKQPGEGSTQMTATSTPAGWKMGLRTWIRLDALVRPHTHQYSRVGLFQ